MNEPILFSTGRCALGIALVAKSERGLCALLLGDDPEALALEIEGALQSRLRFKPRVELLPPDSLERGAWKAKLVEVVRS